MTDINSVVLVGNLTRDAELRYTQTGTAIVNGSIASNRRAKKGESWVDEASFFEFTTMGKSSEGLHKYLVKGKKIAISGELRQERWEKDGQSRSKVLVFAHAIQLLSQGEQPKKNPEHDPAYIPNQPKKTAQQESFEDDTFEDDIPF